MMHNTQTLLAKHLTGILAEISRRLAIKYDIPADDIMQVMSDVIDETPPPLPEIK